MLLQLDEAGRTNWTTHIKNLFFSNGFGHVWIFHNVGDDNEFLCIFKKRIIDCFTQKWYSEIDVSSKALHYKKFKTLLDPEFYLNTSLSYILQKTLANCTCSSHDLMIEKGRHLSIDREYRFCPICKSKDIYIVEDKFHFFFHCSVYKELRIKYLTLSQTSPGFYVSTV